MFSRLTFYFIIIFIFCSINYAQDFNVNYGAQLDATSILFVNTLSGSFEIDLIKIDLIKIDKVNYAGFRFGVDHYSKSSFDGSKSGSPYTDVDFLGRLTLNGKLIEVNLCPGFAFHKNTAELFNNEKKNSM